MVRAIVDDKAPVVFAAAEVTPDLDRVVEMALAKQPKDRGRAPANGGETGGFRKGGREHQNNCVSLKLGNNPAPAKMTRRRWMAAAAVAVAAAGLAIWSIAHRRNTPAHNSVLPGGETRGGLPFKRSVPMKTPGRCGRRGGSAHGKTDTNRGVPGESLRLFRRASAKRKIASAEDAWRIYGANLVITGSAQKLGDRIQFTANLVDSRTLTQLGAKEFFDFDRPESGCFARRCRERRL